ncbi:MAG: hypothetical protein ACFFC7_01425 [Candidatus Hermodarchaeota archaeon]
MISLEEVLKACEFVLPESFRKIHTKLFEKEHISTLAGRLIEFWENGVPKEFPLPHLSVECTPSLSEAFFFFQEPLKVWENQKHMKSPEILRMFADALVNATCKNILILMGQRLTPASITDARAIPPTKEELMKSAMAIYKEELTIAARAWTKHAHRSPEKFWGEVQGTTTEKNEFVAKIITKILEASTWWNVFGHYKHETIYEARVKTGHGARWGKNGTIFIGFVEPFDPESGTIFET